MSKISLEMLNQTVSLLTLAMENAHQQGKDMQADQIASIEGRLRNIASDATVENTLPAHGSVTRDPGFQHLIKISQEKSRAEGLAYQEDKNMVIQSMSHGGMSDVEIARQMGMTTEEVALITRLGRR